MRIIVLLKVAVCALTAVVTVSCIGTRGTSTAGARPPLAPAIEAQAPIYDIPCMDKVVVDGKADDWGDGGFRVDLLMPVGVSLLNPERVSFKPVADHDARMRLGWNRQGLLMLITLRDDKWVEWLNKEELWQRDSVEIFMSEKRGSAVMCQWMISPGMDPKQSEPRSWLYDYRRSPELMKLPAEPIVARTGKGDACSLEVLLPWTALKIDPQIGREVGLQVWVNDADKDENTAYHVAWYPAVGAYMYYDRVHRVRLANHPSPPVRVRGSGEHQLDALRTKVELTAQADCAGKVATLVDRPAGKPDQTGQELGSARLVPDGAGRAMAKLDLPMPAFMSSGGTVEIDVDGKLAGTFVVPDPARTRAELFMCAKVAAKPSVFEGEELPVVGFEYPLWIEGLIGPYQARTTYYDRDYNVVTKAEKPGRYGAVTEVVARDGRVHKRFTTLFRCPAGFELWRLKMKTDLDFPKEAGISSTNVALYRDEIAGFAKEQIAEGIWRTSDAAVLLAGLFEMPAGAQQYDFYASPALRDRQWWVGLKRKLYGWDRRWPAPFVCPRPIEGPPAPVLREGTLAEAGMKPDAVSKIDSVLTEWAGDTDESFAVCIARHGVIFLHKAYGMRDGKPMTIETPSRMASSTKMLSGTLVMMLVDQGLVDLEDTPDKFLPPLAGLRTSKPVTVRAMYLHTAGMYDYDGEGANDMEERIASLFPFFRVGERYQYDGTGMTLTCKILEAISGESLPAFYKKHLFDPLECRHTTVADATHGTRSVPLDYAKVCQMLLNKGAYGNMRFMREETFKKMLPKPLADIYGPEAANWGDHTIAPGWEIGIGTVGFPEFGLGKTTFGHHAASRVTVRIDPSNDLVIVMTRNTDGKNFSKYYGKWIASIVDGIAK